MGLIATIKGWLSLLIPEREKTEWGIRPETSAEVDAFIGACAKAYRGEPDWLDTENHVKTINFAKAVCSETARLATLDVAITVSGSARGDWIQGQLDAISGSLRHWAEYGCAYGTMILKPNGEAVDCVTPGAFVVTDSANGEITGVVFQSKRYDPQRERWFTRLEYHRFLTDGTYVVSNRCYVSRKADRLGDPCAIETTPWVGLLEDVEIQNVEKPLFGVFRTPAANNIETGSPLGMPIFADALEELEDLDVAYSRNAKEIADSKRTLLLDSDRLFPSGTKIRQSYADKASSMGLPDFIKAVEGGAPAEVYHEINPSLNTDMRLQGINALLSQIGYKCGFSNGYFVFNENSGLATATQVEADQQRTVQLIKDVRDKLESCLDGLIYALDKFADLYDLAPAGTYEVTYDFGDLTYNEDEDRARWLGYVTQRYIPMWYYLHRFEGFSEDEAKALVAAAQPAETLFGAEE